MSAQLLIEQSLGSECLRCKSAILVGAPVVLVGVGPNYAPPYPYRYHARCALDVWPHFARAALSLNPVTFDGRPAVETLLASRIEAIEEWGLAWSRVRIYGGTASLPSVEMAKDPSGRPRVTVYLGGDFSSPKLSGGRFWEVVEDLDFASPSREYSFALSNGPTPIPMDSDPSQPLIGAVFSSSSDHPIMPTYRQIFAGWRNEGVPLPVLWIWDQSGEQARADKRVLTLRRALTRVGYVGDEAQVVIMQTFDTSAVERLVQTLDEALALIKVRELNPRRAARPQRPG